PNAAARSKDNNRTLIEPEPVDGWVNYDSYLANNLNLPEEFRQQKNTESKSVELSFEVDKNGEPVNIRVEKSLCNSCDKEAIRLVKEGPKWKRNAAKKGRTKVTINF
ncbi:MAG TPA: energy transducer TonB, partial [Chitinophagaceae bacterium]|nr:energy transducer TonB [Chitinophagaceae bacterium]